MDWFNCFAEAPQRVIAFVHRLTTLASNLWDDPIVKREEELTIRNQTDVNVLNNQDVVINVAQTDAGVSGTTSLLSQAPLNAQTTGGSDMENPPSLSPADQDVVINVDGAVIDQTDVGVSHTIPISAQATTSFNIVSSSRSVSPFEVVSNGNAYEVRDQTGVDMSDTSPLLPQTLIAAQATSSSQIQNHRNLPREVDDLHRLSLNVLVLGQNSSGVANGGSGMPSQHSRQPLSPIEGHNNDIIQAVITDAKEVFNRLVQSSVGVAVVGVVALNFKKGVANQLKDNPFFTAFVSLGIILLPLASGLYRLINIKHPESIPGFARIVKFTNKLSNLVLIYTTCCGFCILSQSVAVKVVIMIAPVISMGFVATLEWIGYARRDQIET